MPHYKLLFPNKYVGAWDMEDGEKVVTIRAIDIDDLRLQDGSSEQKPVLHFEKTKKTMVLNKTNAATIAELYGTNTDKWIGKRIKLFASTCLAFGKQVECVRVRPEKPSGGNGKRKQREPDYDPETGEVYEDGEVPADKEPTDADLNLTSPE